MLQAVTEQPPESPSGMVTENVVPTFKSLSQVIRAVWMNVGKSITGHVMYKTLKTLGRAGMSLYKYSTIKRGVEEQSRKNTSEYLHQKFYIQSNP